MKIIYIALTVAISACATASSVRYIPIDYRVIDHPDAQILQLVYHNRGSKKVCIGPDNWPSQSGIIDNSGEEFYIDVEGEKYFLKQEQDYCPNCVTKVKHNQTIESKLTYASFGLPEMLYGKTKTLHLNSIGYTC